MIVWRHLTSAVYVDILIRVEHTPTERVKYKYHLIHSF